MLLDAQRELIQRKAGGVMSYIIAIIKTQCFGSNYGS